MSERYKSQLNLDVNLFNCNNNRLRTSCWSTPRTSYIRSSAGNSNAWGLPFPNFCRSLTLKHYKLKQFSIKTETFRLRCKGVERNEKRRMSRQKQNRAEILRVLWGRCQVAQLKKSNSNKNTCREKYTEHVKYIFLNTSPNHSSFTSA